MLLLGGGYERISYCDRQGRAIHNADFMCALLMRRPDDFTWAQIAEGLHLVTGRWIHRRGSIWHHRRGAAEPSCTRIGAWKGYARYTGKRRFARLAAPRSGGSESRRWTSSRP